MEAAGVEPASEATQPDPSTRVALRSAQHPIDEIDQGLEWGTSSWSTTHGMVDFTGTEPEAGGAV